MSRSFHKSLTFAAALVMLAGVAGTASAATTWQKNHPRRTQVHQRLAHRHHGSHHGVQHGSHLAPK
jgi:hypothetical protein